MENLLLVGRLILGGYFIYSGVNHFIGLAMMAQYAQMKGVPFPKIALSMTGIMLLLGGLSILFGTYPLIGIILLIAFLVPVSLMMHNFWEDKNPQSRMADKVNFMKNMALIGAILMLLAIPLPWPLSFVP